MSDPSATNDPLRTGPAGPEDLGGLEEAEAETETDVDPEGQSPDGKAPGDLSRSVARVARRAKHETGDAQRRISSTAGFIADGSVRSSSV